MTIENTQYKSGAHAGNHAECIGKAREHNPARFSPGKGFLLFGLLLCLGMLLVEASSFGQDGTGGQNSQMTSPVAANIRTLGRRSNVASPGGANSNLDTPVVTLAGTCEGPQKNAAAGACNTVITRGEIESMISVLGADASPAGRREFAVNYAKLAAAYGAAQQRHLEKDPGVARELQMYENLVRMQVLANALQRQIRAKASSIVAADVERFYEEHKSDFEQGTIKRLNIPKSLIAQSGSSSDIALLKAKAEELRARAAAGEDFDKLQQDAYKDLGARTAMPPTKFTNVRRSRLLPADSQVFDLAPGSVTPVLDSSNEFSILGLESKRLMPVEEVRLEISAILQRERTEQELHDAMQSINAQFNLSYLNLVGAPELLPPPELVGLTVPRGTPGDLAQRSALRPQAWRSKRSVMVFPQTKP